MARISTSAELEIKTLLVNWWAAVNTQLAAVTGAAVQIGNAPVDVLYTSEIGQRLVRIAELAEAITVAENRHEAYPWHEALAAQILEDCETVENWLGNHTHQDAFWTSPVGFMILRAKVWAHQDQLITLSTAAEISGMSLSVLSQRMTRGQLPGYRDPKIKNPKHGRRVRLSDLRNLMTDTANRIPFPSPAYLLMQPARVPAPSSPRSS